LSLRSKPLESTGRGWQGQGSRRSGLGAQVGLALTDGGGKRQYLEVLSWPAKARNSHSKLKRQTFRFGLASTGEFDFERQPIRF